MIQMIMLPNTLPPLSDAKDFSCIASDGLHLMGNLAAIDRGIDAGVITDIDGERRPLRNGYDLGADEIDFLKVYLPVVLKSP